MTRVDVAFFDMDHTILDVDCSVIWKRFLADEDLAPAEDAARAEHFVSLYHQGRYPVEERSPLLRVMRCSIRSKTPR